MMRAYWTYGAVAAMFGIIATVHGCTINIFSPGDLEPPNQGLGGSPATSSSGNGGSGGSGGSSCTCGPADSNPCTDDLTGACPNGDENACHPALATGMPCDSGGKPGTCDAAGMCVGCSECSDPGCTDRCVGQKCAVPKECANGNCVDGYCCDSACDGPCNACNRVPGSCQPLPVGITSDVAGECTGLQACDNTGSCKTQQYAVLGALCTVDANCESGKCVGQICVSLNGQPCVEDLECGSRLCDPTTHKCIACTASSTCPNNVTCLPGGICAAQLGQPATMTAECEPPGVLTDNLMCTLPPGEACTTNAECTFRDCNGAPSGTCAGPCTVNGECPFGSTCDNPNGNGWCRLPPGSYCVINDQCQGAMGIGKCTGFPRRCQ